MRASLPLLLLCLAACAPDTENACSDGEDNDRDGATDCADSDCASEDSCADDADGDRYTEPEGDCDDTDPAVNPAAAEICNGIDDDCDGLVDDQDPGTQDEPVWYLDADGDGWGLADEDEQACDAPSDHSATPGDCDDEDAAAFPGAAEAESPEACMRDADDDGWGDQHPASAGVEPGTDCDDSQAGTNPAATETWYDDVDADCDGWDDYDQDHDGDRIDSGGGGDCDDSDPAINSDDDDGDGYHPCSGDCDDDDPGVHPGVFELNDGVDNDCDGEVDYTGLGNADAVLLGVTAGARAGAAVSGFADVDGDGHDDILVGATEEGSGGGGEIYLAHGPISGELSLEDAAVLIVGESSGGMAGAALAPAGDVDGDGVPDLLVGAPKADYRGTEAGAAYLLLGPIDSGGLVGADRRFTGETIEDQAGSRVAAGGDVDGDGRDDLLVGAPYAESASRGAAYLLLDAAASTDTTGLEDADLILRGVGTGDQAGWGVAINGDLNGDGLADVVVGAPEADGGGAIYVIHGDAEPAGLLGAADSTVAGMSPGDRAGACLAVAGDVDWDGHTDLIVGAPGADGGAGAAYLLLGPFSADMSMADAGASFSGLVAGDGAGAWVAAAGSVDGDDYDDILLGVDPSSGADPVLVRGPVWGAMALSDADGIYVGESASDGAGASMAAAGDTDGDGIGDLLIGAPTHSGAASEAGAVYLILGGPER
jgi:hypothetical protein